MGKGTQRGEIWWEGNTEGVVHDISPHLCADVGSPGGARAASSESVGAVAEVDGKAFWPYPPDLPSPLFSQVAAEEAVLRRRRDLEREHAARMAEAEAAVRRLQVWIGFMKRGLPF